MINVFDLKEGDIIYGFCIDTQLLEVYYVEKVNISEIIFHPIIGDDSDFYLMFPNNLDLEKPILCKYTKESWWIYTVNFDSIKNLIELDWDFIPDFIKAFYFDEYLDMWKQKVCKLK